MTDDTETPNLYNVYVNDTYVGTVAKEQTAHKCLQIAKEALAEGTEEITFMDANMRLEGVHEIVGVITGSSELIENISALLPQSIQQTLQRSYMLKINNYLVALSGVDEVEQVLQAAIDMYDGESDFDVTLKRDTERAFNVLTAEVASADAAESAPCATDSPGTACGRHRKPASEACGSG